MVMLSHYNKRCKLNGVSEGEHRVNSLIQKPFVNEGHVMRREVIGRRKGTHTDLKNLKARKSL